MAQKASGQDRIDAMTDEVIRLANEKKVSFNKAFAWVAHRANIFHHHEPTRYNYFFKEVLTCFNKRNKAELKKALTGPRPWQHGKIKKGIRRPKPGNHQGRTRLKPGIEVEAFENPYLDPQLSFPFQTST